MVQSSELRPYRLDHVAGMVIEWDVGIPMDDGLVLRADVFRPAAEGRCPIILSYGPYAKGLPFAAGYPDQWRRITERHPEILRGSTGRYHNWQVVDPEKWVPDGFVCVRVDSRGAGRSPGLLNPFSARETRDYYLCIEWAAVQPWSNGKVGLLGISYYAINQWHVAGLQPPHLTAVCPWEGAADWYRDMTRHGGIVCSFWSNWIKQRATTVQHGVGARGPAHPYTGEQVAGPETLSDDELTGNRVDLRQSILAHPLDNAYYRERSADWSKVRVPFLSAGNWGGQGLHLRGNIEGFVRAASQEKWLEMHGGEHWTEFYTDYGLSLQKRFFGHYLQSRSTGWQYQSPVLLQVRHIDGLEPRNETAWPIPRTRWTRFYLEAGTRSLLLEPSAREEAVTYAALGDGVTFATKPFTEGTEITGPAAAKLFVASSTTDADLFLVLRVFGPGGNEVTFQGARDAHAPVSRGWLRASHRHLDSDLSTSWRPYHSHDRLEPLRPGEIYEVDIEIWPTSIALPAGHRIALTIFGKDFEGPEPGPQTKGFARPRQGSGSYLHDDPEDRPQAIFRGRYTLHTGGPRRSHVLLPVIPPA